MPHTLLLADDSVTIQRVIELTFADEDIQVVAVSDGDQAIARLESAPPDIVLADIGMPGRNGYEVARYVKQSPKLAHIPVVLLTGAFEPVDQARAAEVGCDGVLAKPFEPQLVIGRVKELLATPAQAVAHAARASVAEARAAGDAPSAATPVAELDDYFDRLDVAFAKLSAGPAAQTPRAPGDAPDALAESEEMTLESALEEEHPPSVADEIDRYALRTAPAPDMPLSYSSHPDFEPAERGVGAPAKPDRGAGAPGVNAEAPIHAETAPIPADVPIPAEAPIPAAPPIAAPPIAAAPPLTTVPPMTPATPMTGAAPMTPMPVTTATQFTAEAPVAAANERPAAGHPLPSIAEAFTAILAAEQHEATPDVAPGWPIFRVAPPAPVAPPTIEITDDLIERIASRVLERLSDRVVREATVEIITGVADRLVREEIERIKAAIR
ncbi:MAG TPA: response regulator [Vicinamibacterales bacterium]|nr:response regulator [Vicinamibacterales bacterium]